MLLDIDKDTYVLNNTNFYNKTFKKTQIVIGHSGRKDMRHFESWLNRRNGKYRKTSPFSIDSNGNIYQHFDPSYYSDFLGGEQDKNIISITLVNQGWLKLNENNVYVDWLGHIYSKETGVVEKNWRDYRYWCRYSDEQLESLKKLIIYLCDKFDIEKNIITNNVYNENTDIFKGVVFRSNYFKDLTDVSPAFEIEKIIS
jgi:N-acetyl-anhydromuramyl-L-alanine amidase AmpD